MVGFCRHVGVLGLLLHLSGGSALGSQALAAADGGHRRQRRSLRPRSAHRPWPDRPVWPAALADGTPMVQERVLRRLPPAFERCTFVHAANFALLALMSSGNRSRWRFGTSARHGARPPGWPLQQAGSPCCSAHCPSAFWTCSGSSTCAHGPTARPRPNRA